MSKGGFIKPSPALSSGFDRIDADGSETMTMLGTIHKTIALLVAATAVAVLGWLAGGSTLGAGLGLAAVIAAFIIGLITVFKPHLAPKTALIYAVLEGYALGVVSRFAETSYPGIVLTTVGLTAAVFAVMLTLYRTRIIKVTRTFVLAVTAATAGIALYYLIALVVGAAGGHLPLIQSAGPAGIVFSLLVVGVAAANLAVDFDFIEGSESAGMPAYTEWYAAFSLMVTLVWLYLELLRLMMKIKK